MTDKTSKSSVLPHILTVAAVLLVGAGFAIWDMNKAPRGMKAAPQEATTDPAPAITFTELDGTQTDLHAFQGKTILLNVWATWCPPCIIELPQMIALARAERERLVLIALSVDEDKDKIMPMIARFAPDIQEAVKLDNIIIAHDAGKTISRDTLGITRYPETLIIRPDMTISRKVQGVIDWRSMDTKRMIFEER